MSTFKIIRGIARLFIKRLPEVKSGEFCWDLLQTSRSKLLPVNCIVHINFVSDSCSIVVILHAFKIYIIPKCFEIKALDLFGRKFRTR